MSSNIDDKFGLLLKECMEKYSDLDQIVDCIKNSDESKDIALIELDELIKKFTLSCKVVNGQKSCIYCKEYLDINENLDYHDNCHEYIVKNPISEDHLWDMRKDEIKEYLRENNISWNLSVVESAAGLILRDIQRHLGVSISDQLEFLDRSYYNNNPNDFLNENILKKYLGTATSESYIEKEDIWRDVFATLNNVIVGLFKD